ncbi:hypothetical protein ACOME3_005541 [Neoechinorhynchus agilis]
MSEDKLNLDYKKAKSIYDFAAMDIDGNLVDLERYRGKYNHLQELFNKYSSSGLRILAFPCNQFGSQEPWPESEIKAFAAERGVTFDMFSKIEVNGSKAHPLFKYLKSQTGGFLGSFVKWNFTKFLINKQGKPMKRYGTNVDSKNIEGDLKDLLDN